MLILKLGGSVITKKFNYMEADEKNIENLARMLSEVWEPKMNLVLIHGAGSFGHAPVIAHGISKGVKSKKQILGYADTHSSTSYLSNLFTDRLIKNGVPAVSIPPAVIVRQASGRITKLEDKVIKDYMKKGFLPVLYGDVVLDSKIGGSVCSGDQLGSYLGKKAKRVIMGTDVDGVLVDGRVVDKITKKNFKEVEKHIKNSAVPDVTGGMMGKVKELMSIKKPAFIVNALKPKRVEDALKGRPTIGTEVSIK